MRARVGTRIVGVAGLTALWALGCGLPGPTTKVLENDAFTIEVFDGDVTTHDDYGAEGDYDVDWGFSTQAVSWNRIEPDVPLETEIGDMFDAMAAIAAAEPDLDFPSTRPSWVEGAVDGRRSLSFQADMGPLSLSTTVWFCTEAGVKGSLVTTGLGSSSSNHDKSIASVKCKNEPVAFRAGSRSFRFVGDEAAWTPDPDADPEAPEWTNKDQTVFVSLAGSSSLAGDGDLPALCRSTMGLILDNLAASVELDESAQVFREAKRGCSMDWAGSRISDGTRIRGRYEHDDCGGRGYLFTCLVSSDEPLDAACNGLAACPDAAGSTGPSVSGGSRK